MNYLNTKNKFKCYGCGACSAICTQKAISMNADEEGFVYPVISPTMCTNCGLCDNVCPENEKNIFHSPPKSVYAVKCCDGDKILSSSSGGTFFAITKACHSNTQIYGAMWQDRSHVVHIGAKAPTAYDLFRKSKYIQSKTNAIYAQIKQALESNASVVFTGTPCQCAALQTFLGHKYDNLLLVDLICHGVSNGKILESCLKCFDRKTDKISSISFRHKKLQNGEWNSKLVKINYSSGKERILDYNTFGFLRGYDNGLIFRPSCSTCQYAQSSRVSDLTIGDYWGGESKGYNPHYGASVVLVNSNLGAKFFEKMKEYLIYEQVDFDDIARHNPRLRAPDCGNPNRNAFLENLETENFEDAMQHYAPRIPIWKIIGHRIKSKLIPHSNPNH